jgi:hypothetical protein
MQMFILQKHYYLELFQKGDYKNARDMANDVIENSGRSLMTNYKDAFNSSENTNEDLFAMQVTSQSGENDLITFYADEIHGVEVEI